MYFKIILITGGNTGLGLEIARALCRSSKSYKTLLAGRSLERATAAIEKLASVQLNGSTTVEPIQLDVEDDESINAAFKFVEEQFGRLDILVVNNADEEREESGWSAYRSAEIGMDMMMREWARVLKEDTVKVCAVSPGLLATGLGGDQELLRQMGVMDPQIGVELVTSVIEGERDADMGLVINKAGVQPW
ncbi:short chain dehydrogenase [Trichoderma harzianum]|uniref:Short chain dehydrogenase n=1 Tax=Trichoderma harzianum TaxID=5544 RepID=A0A0F9ZL94_TRIHA|nr:short chain dehydrogenase [Trichoderma harzianum]